MTKIFSYHPSESKVTDIKKIYVDIHPDYKTSRCFILETSEGEKIDVSFHKCLGNLYLE